MRAFQSCDRTAIPWYERERAAWSVNFAGVTVSSRDRNFALDVISTAMCVSFSRATD